MFRLRVRAGEGVEQLNVPSPMDFQPYGHTAHSTVRPSERGAPISIRPNSRRPRSTPLRRR
jgi:hypothetical protein